MAPQANDLHQIIGDVPVITAAQVIAKRQTAILGRMNDVDDRIIELSKELELLKLERAELAMEHDMLERFDERNMVRTIVPTRTTTEVSGRMSSSDRMNFEDSLRAIMRDAGRPLQFKDIRNRLEKSGYKWNNNVSAHNYITRCGVLENAGKRGIYQLIRK